MADKRPSKNVQFGPFTLSYPHLSAPDEKFGDSLYRADGVEDPNSPAMKEAKAVFAKALKEWDLDDDATLPLVREMVKDPKEPEGKKKPKKVPTGKLLLKTKSKKMPPLTDIMGKLIDNGSIDIGGGTRAILSGFIAPYDFNGKEGISFTLTGVQIIKLVERGGGGAITKPYTGDDGEYVGDGTKAPPADDLNLSDDDADDSQGDGGVLDI